MSTDVLYFSFSHSALVLARVRSLRSRACSFSEKNDEKEKENNVCVQATIKQDGNFRTFRQARVLFVDFVLANTPVIFIVKLVTRVTSVILRARDQNVLFILNVFVNAGPSPSWPVSRPVGVVNAGYAFYALTSSRNEVILARFSLPAWQGMFERQKSQNDRQPISKWQILEKTAELPREPCVPNF